MSQQNPIPQNSNLSESMISEQLPDRHYSFDAPNSSINDPELNESIGSIDDDLISNQENSKIPKRDDIFFHKIHQIKANYDLKKTLIFNQLGLKSKQVISTIAKNDTLLQNFSEKHKQLLKILENQTQAQNNNQKLSTQTEIIDTDLRITYQTKEFKAKIQKILAQEQENFNREDSSIDFKSLLISKLQALSAPILQKLEPYFKEYLKIKGAKNKELEHQNFKLEQVGRKIYEQELERIKNEIGEDKQLRELNELHDKIENQKNYGRQLDKYISRNDADIKFMNSQKA